MAKFIFMNETEGVYHPVVDLDIEGRPYIPCATTSFELQNKNPKYNSALRGYAPIINEISDIEYEDLCDKLKDISGE